MKMNRKKLETDLAPTPLNKKSPLWKQDALIRTLLPFSYGISEASYFEYFFDFCLKKSAPLRQAGLHP